MKRHFIIPLLTVFTLLCSCTEPEPPTVGQETAFDTVCNKENDGKRVAVEGFLTFPKSIKRDILVLRLRKSKELDNKVIGVSTAFGTDVNQATPLKSSSYSHQDLKVKTQDGQTVGYLDQVRVSGKVYYPISSTVEFKCSLSNVLVERN